MEYGIRYTDRIYGNVRTVRRGPKLGDLAWAQDAARRERGEWADYDIACHIVVRETPGDEWQPHGTVPQLADTNLGHPGTIAPYSCRWCQVDRRGHGILWISMNDGDRFIGSHCWEPPTQPQIKLRMQARRARAARLAGVLPPLQG
ncbi:hypothetical protein [Nonomuraea sp. NPDC052265]|uniref:hypothetical protein n=1 Tax=Nonomuraea sp. NPDC052265 TaxID=3364374 RepID=UPI0037C565A5